MSDINSSVSIDKIIIYLRKSRSDDPSMSVEEVLAKHETQLQEYAVSEFGCMVPEDHIFREVVSGETIADRPVMKQVMSLLETGSIRGVLVIEPQRLSRGDMEDCGRIINAFRYTNTLVITPPKTYDLSEEYDRKFFEMELTRGNDYLEYTKKILNRGRVASVRQGNFIGSIAPYGYRKIKVGTGKEAYHTLEVIPEEADAVKLMYHLFLNEGYGFKRIADHLDSLGIKPRNTVHWSPAAIKDMLENPVYIGKIRWNHRKVEKKLINGVIVKTRPKNPNESDWVLADGKHEAIIDEDSYNAVLQKRGKNPCIRKNKELLNPFAGILVCGTCGRSMSYRVFRQHRGKREHVCTSMICDNQTYCKTKSVKYEEFFERVVTSIEDTIHDFEVKIETDDGSSARIQKNIIQNLEFELEKLRAKDARQKDAYEDGTYTKEEYILRNAKLQEQIQKTMKSLFVAKNSVPESVDYGEKLLRFKDCLAALLNPEVTPAEKNRLLKDCIDKIVYYNDMESRPGGGRWIKNEFRLEVFMKL